MQTFELHREFDATKTNRRISIFMGNDESLYVQAFELKNGEWLSIGSFHPINWTKGIEGNDRAELVTLVNGITFNHLWEFISGDVNSFTIS